MAPSAAGGQKSGGGGSSSERTEDVLYQEAEKRHIEGRSTMTKQQMSAYTVMCPAAYD
ncbi:hypothetical protein ABZ924_19550 [Streptomyces sp. NPDC046876]|uniref:hypothetical protein n=1 Tax=Streptomyces sp. NPDC046876 TaxID=3155616 RepID=UPI0033E789E9